MCRAQRSCRSLLIICDLRPQWRLLWGTPRASVCRGSRPAMRARRKNAGYWTKRGERSSLRPPARDERKRDTGVVIRAQERNAGAMGHSPIAEPQPFGRGGRETLSPVSLFSGENRKYSRTRRAPWRESLSRLRECASPSRWSSPKSRDPSPSRRDSSTCEIVSSLACMPRVKFPSLTVIHASRRNRDECWKSVRDGTLSPFSLNVLLLLPLGNLDRRGWEWKV